MKLVTTTLLCDSMWCPSRIEATTWRHAQQVADERGWDSRMVWGRHRGRCPMHRGAR
ncbi:MAG: hypothetical protein HOV79_00295 [Hamadaea sp.]|nr:hypothetical protein [Hamadaea sp.]